MESIVKVEVGPNCIGCGLCYGIHPSVFEMDEKGRSRLKTGIVFDHYLDEINDAAGMCPVKNIIVK